MKSINTYLTFNGNCREAMNFYQSCLGGELSFQTIGESPMADRMPDKMKDCILHATLSIDNLTIMGTDMAHRNGLIKGNAISMMLNCNSEEDIKTCYQKLSEGGTPTHPIEHTFWGAMLGDLTDKYGNPWVLHFQKNQ